MENKEPFRTTNQPLAYALANAGCRFAPQDEQNGGPAQNLYTVGFLRHHKIGVGMPFEKAVRLAVKHKIPGAVTYIFERDEVFDRVIKTWDIIHKEWQDAAQEHRDPSLPDISPEQIAQVLFIYFNQLAKLEEVPWFNPPICSTASVTRGADEPVMKNGKEAPGKKNHYKGSGKIWTLGASKELKTHLKI